MAKLIFKEIDDDFYPTQNGYGTLELIDSNTRKYSFSAEHKPYSPVGALNFQECETVYHFTHPRVPHDVWLSYYEVHNTRFELQFNIMRIVMDILNGKDVIIMRGGWDDFSVELFRDFLYKKYGLMMYDWEGDYNIIPDAEFNPISRHQFAVEIENVKGVISKKCEMDGVSYDYKELGMFYPYNWKR